MPPPLASSKPSPSEWSQPRRTCGHGSFSQGYAWTEQPAILRISRAPPPRVTLSREQSAIELSTRTSRVLESLNEAVLAFGQFLASPRPIDGGEQLLGITTSRLDLLGHASYPVSLVVTAMQTSHRADVAV